MKKINTIITLATMVLSLNGFTGEGKAGVNLDKVIKLQKEKEKALKVCIKKAKDLNRLVFSEQMTSFELSNREVVGFARSRFDYNLLTFRPIPCVDPHMIIKVKESPQGEKPVQMPSYEIVSQKFDAEKEDEKLKFTMLNKCSSITKRLKACDEFKKIKEEELNKINSIKEEDRLRSEVEESTPRIEKRQSEERFLEAAIER